MRRLLATASLAALLPAVSAEAQGAPSWLDLLSPDRILQSALQSGVMALRSQADITYGGMDVDLRAGRVTLTDLRVWPLPPWDLDGDCEISIDRLTLRTAALDEPARLRLKVQAQGAAAPAICLPDEPREGLAMAGLEMLDIPRFTFDIDYDVPSAGAEASLHATVTGVGTADMTAEMSYLAFDGREDMEEPEPVIFLESAMLSVSDDGLWEVLQPMLPPEFLSAGDPGMMMQGLLGGMLAEANADTPEFSEGGDPGSLTAEQRAFVDSVAEAWPAFLATPERLVLETDIDGDVYLDFAAIEDNPREVFAALRPRLALAPAQAATILPAGLLRDAIRGGSGLSPEDRRRAGLALVSGNGAPRNLEAGVALLSALAEDGDGAAALELSDALAVRDPEAAYRWALAAGAAGEAGAAARLDRLEDGLGMATVLEIQDAVAGPEADDMGALGALADIRETAAMRLSGRGMARDYGLAAMWAMIGRAAGDPEAADILDEIDDRMRMADDEGRARWAETEGRASARAMEAWLDEDLPARFSE